MATHAFRDPHIKRPTGRLQKCHSPVVNIHINAEQNQIMTVCADKRIKIFDIRNFRCIQEQVDNVSYTPVDAITASGFDHASKRIIAGGKCIDMCASAYIYVET